MSKFSSFLFRVSISPFYVINMNGIRKFGKGCNPCKTTGKVAAKSWSYILHIIHLSILRDEFASRALNYLSVWKEVAIRTSVSMSESCRIRYEYHGETERARKFRRYIRCCQDACRNFAVLSRDKIRRAQMFPIYTINNTSITSYYQRTAVRHDPGRLTFDTNVRSPSVIVYFHDSWTFREATCHETPTSRVSRRN